MRYPIWQLLFVLSLLSCEQTTEPPEIQTPLEFENSQKPIDNHLVQQSYTLGNEQFFSLFNLAEPSSTSGMYAVGAIDAAQASIGTQVGSGSQINDYYDPVLFKFSDAGELLWEKRPGFTIQSLLVIPTGILGPTEYILLAGFDENEDDPSDPDRNRLMLFDSNGQFLSGFEVDFQMNMNALLVSASTADAVEITMAGGFYTSVQNDCYPGLTKVQIDKTNFEFTQFQATEFLQDDWIGVYFQNIALLDDQILVSGFDLDDCQNNGKYIALHTAAFSYSQPEQNLWHTVIHNNNHEIFHFQRGIHLENGLLYICGSVRDQEKQKNSVNLHWTSGFIACLDANSGSVLWNKKYAKSIFDDRFFDIHFWDEKLISVGVSSMSYCSSCTQEFIVGNAWINTIDPASGEVFSSRLLGDSGSLSLINQFCIKNNLFWGFGYKSEIRSTAKALVWSLDPNAL